MSHSPELSILLLLAEWGASPSLLRFLFSDGGDGLFFWLLEELLGVLLGVTPLGVVVLGVFFDVADLGVVAFGVLLFLPPSLLPLLTSLPFFFLSSVPSFPAKKDTMLPPADEEEEELILKMEGQQDQHTDAGSYFHLQA